MNMMSLANLRYIQSHSPEEFCVNSKKNDIQIKLKECILHLAGLEKLLGSFAEKGISDVHSEFVNEFKEEFKLVESWKDYLSNYLRAAA